MPTRTPVWGFPNGYNPNLFGLRCERCHRSDRWIPKQCSGQPFTAWTCAACTAMPMGQKLEIPE